MNNSKSTHCHVCNSDNLSYMTEIDGKLIFKCTNCDLVFSNCKFTYNDFKKYYDKFISNDESFKSRKSEINQINKYLRTSYKDYRFIIPSFFLTNFISLGVKKEKLLILNDENFADFLNGGIKKNIYDNQLIYVIYHLLEFSSSPNRLIKSMSQLIPHDSECLIIYRDNKNYILNFLKKWRDIYVSRRRSFFSDHNLKLIMKNNYFQLIDKQRLFSEITIKSLKNLWPSPFFLNFFNNVTLKKYAGLNLQHFKKIKKPNLISIIVPIYNEIKYCEIILKNLKKIKLPLPYEVIIVDSYSSDGTREVVKKYESDSMFRIYYQDLPQGKGNAVRHGLKKIRGDIIIIQDADLEYDLNDYNELIYPILNNETDFVLGSRTLGANNWKVRSYDKTPIKAALMNFAQIVFAKTYNILFSCDTTDINTMFKVFRSSCLKNFVLKSNGFEFDIELASKLALSGFKPIELPVNYNSRGFDDGKKIRFFHDAFHSYLMLFRCFFGKEKKR